MKSLKSVIAIRQFLCCEAHNQQKQIAIFSESNVKETDTPQFSIFSSTSSKIQVGNRQNNLGFWVANAVTHVSRYFEL